MLLRTTLSLATLLCCFSRAATDTGEDQCRSFMQGQSAYDRQTILSATTCSGLRLTAVPVTVLSSTNVLRFDNNVLRYVHEDVLARFYALEQLDFSSNQITALSPFTFNGSSRLTDLSLANNQIQQFPNGLLAPLANLLTLNVSYNFLRSIVNGTFATLRNLTVLDLSSNEIDTIAIDAFRNLHKLQELRLVRNQLQTLSSEMEPYMPHSLNSVLLGHNSWRCDCHLLWLKQYLLGSGSRAAVNYDKPDVVCMYGMKDVKTKQLQTVSFTYMACPPELYSPRAAMVHRSATLGANVRFDCSIFASPNKREVVWMKDGERLTAMTYYVSRFSIETTSGENFTTSLLISRVDYSDTGTYMCQYEGIAGSVMGNFSLEISNLAGELTLDARRNDDAAASVVTSFFSPGSTFFTIVVSAATACAVVFVVSTVVYCIRTGSGGKRRRRRKPGPNNPAPHAKYDPIVPNHRDAHIDALSAQCAAKFNDEVSSDNLLVNAEMQYNMRTLSRATNDRNVQLAINNCNSDLICSDAAGGSPMLPPPSYNLVCDEFCGEQQFDTQGAPILHHYGTQQRMPHPDGHFCPVHGSKPAALVQPMPSGMMTLNSHHMHQPTCPMFTVALNPNVSPYGTIRRQPCPLHGCVDGAHAHAHQDELPPPQSQFVNSSADAVCNSGNTLANLNVNMNVNGDANNTYMKVSQVDDCIRENMDDSNLRAYSTNVLLRQDNGPKRTGPIAGIEEEGESEALSTVV